MFQCPQNLITNTWNQSGRGTSHTLHREVGGSQAAGCWRLVAVVVQGPRLGGPGPQMHQIQNHHRQEVVDQQGSETQAWWLLGTWSQGLRHIWHPGRPVGKTQLGLLVHLFTYICIQINVTGHICRVLLFAFTGWQRWLSLDHVSLLAGPQ